MDESAKMCWKTASTGMLYASSSTSMLLCLCLEQKSTGGEGLVVVLGGLGLDK